MHSLFSELFTRPDHRALLHNAHAFVVEDMGQNDPSHDMHHVERVVRMGVHLLKSELLTAPESSTNVERCSLLVVLACLLHDVKDFKYSGSEAAGIDAVHAFLSQELTALSWDEHDKSTLVEDVCYIIKNVSFKNELKSSDPTSSEKEAVDQSIDLCARIVQDSDRLDAIGALGIARCLAFSGARNRALYDPAFGPLVGMTKEQYLSLQTDPEMRKHNTAINHFYEKLFLLKDLMKTTTGRKIAEQRTDLMRSYVDQFLKELNQEL